jgi:hypothetical protein
MQELATPGGRAPPALAAGAFLGPWRNARALFAAVPMTAVRCDRLLETVPMIARLIALTLVTMIDIVADPDHVACYA